MSLAARLSVFYAALFAVLGVYMPFWPLWLADRGWDPQTIGTVIATSIWVRAIAGPLLAQVVDRTGNRRRAIIALAWGSLGACLLFWPAADALVPLLLVSALLGLTYPHLIPLTDDITLLATRTHGIAYGPTRLWGSIAFLVVSVGTGAWLAATGRPDTVYWVFLATIAATVVAAYAMPKSAATVKSEQTGAAPLAWLLTQPLFLLALVSAGLVQSSHAAYYGFSTLRWEEAGIAKTTIGLLWAEGVLCEIVLFAVATRRANRLGPALLLTIGAVAAAVRWIVTAESTSVPVLAAVQWLHALSFGATHLGTMLFIQRAVPARMSATAQTLMSSMTVGAAMGLAMMIAGTLFATAPSSAFWAMVVIAALGAGAAVALGYRWNGTQLEDRTPVDSPDRG